MDWKKNKKRKSARLWRVYKHNMEKDRVFFWMLEDCKGDGQKVAECQQRRSWWEIDERKRMEEKIYENK
jgi:hypothetical protein